MGRSLVIGHIGNSSLQIFKIGINPHGVAQITDSDNILHSIDLAEAKRQSDEL